VQFPPTATAIRSLCIKQERGNVADGVMTPVRDRQLVCVSAAGRLHEPQSQIRASCKS